MRSDFLIHRCHLVVVSPQVEEENISAGFLHNDRDLNCQGYAIMTSSPPKVLSPGYYHTSNKVSSYGFWGSNIQTIPLRSHLLIYETV